MVGDTVKEKESEVISQESKAHSHEDAVLEFIKNSLYLNGNTTRENLIKLVLNPDFIGRETINLTNYRTGKSGGKKDFYTGLSYITLDNKGNEGKYISGFMLDESGIGIIDGCETIFNGVMKLEFSRRNINNAGLKSKDVDGIYTCFFPRQENTSVGWFMNNTTPTGSGSIDISNNEVTNPLKPIVNYKLNEYYYKFVKAFSLESLAKGN